MKMEQEISKPATGEQKAKGIKKATRLVTG